MSARAKGETGSRQESETAMGGGAPAGGTLQQHEDEIAMGTSSTSQAVATETSNEEMMGTLDTQAGVAALRSDENAMGSDSQAEAKERVLQETAMGAPDAEGRAQEEADAAAMRGSAD